MIGNLGRHYSGGDMLLIINKVFKTKKVSNSKKKIAKAKIVLAKIITLGMLVKLYIKSLKTIFLVTPLLRYNYI